jgi:hypothetical protein
MYGLKVNTEDFIWRFLTLVNSTGSSHLLDPIVPTTVRRRSSNSRLTILKLVNHRSMVVSSEF